MATVETADEMRYVLDRIIGTESVDQFAQQITDRIDDDCSFFMRFEKQAAFKGISAIGKGIQIRGKVEAYPASRDRAIANLSAYFAEVADDEVTE